MTAREALLERALSDRTYVHDVEVDELAELGRELQMLLAEQAPKAHIDRAAFVQGVRTLESKRPRLLLPAFVTAAACLLLGLVAVGRSAVPGESLYPVREVLDSVGLAPSVSGEADRHTAVATVAIERAEALAPLQQDRADALALEAIGELGVARHLLSGVDADVARARLIVIGLLEQRAIDVIAGDGRADPPESERGTKAGRARDGSVGASPGSSKGSGSQGDHDEGRRNGGRADTPRDKKEAKGPHETDRGETKGARAGDAGSSESSRNAPDLDNIRSGPGKASLKGDIEQQVRIPRDPPEKQERSDKPEKQP